MLTMERTDLDGGGADAGVDEVDLLLSFSVLLLIEEDVEKVAAVDEPGRGCINNAGAGSKR